MSAPPARVYRDPDPDAGPAAARRGALVHPCRPDSRRWRPGLHARDDPPCSAKPLRLPTPAEALPGREEPIDVPGAPLRERQPDRPAVARGHESRTSPSAASGARRRRSGAFPGSTRPPSAIRAASTPNPTYREVCTRPDRPRRGGPRRLRPGAASATRTLLARVLGVARSDPGDAAGERRRDPVPLGDLRPLRRRSGAPRRRRATRTRPRCARAAWARSRPRSATPPASTTPRTYHQQYLAKNPGGYCGLGGTGVSCPIGTGVAARDARSRRATCPHGKRRLRMSTCGTPWSWNTSPSRTKPRFR